MIELDFDEINQAAAQLLAHVLRYTPDRFSAEETIAFRTAVFPKLIDFARADVPCDLKTSIALFEQCLKTSDLGNVPNEAQLPSVDKNVAILLKKLNFSTISSYDRLSSESKTQECAWVEQQVLQIHDSVSNNQKYEAPFFCYKNNNGFQVMLSFGADGDNTQVLKEYFESVKKNNALFTATATQLAQYVDPVIKQTRALQNQFNTPWDLSSAVEKRRATSDGKTDTSEFLGFFN